MMFSNNVIRTQLLFSFFQINYNDSKTISKAFHSPHFDCDVDVFVKYRIL